MVYICYSNSRWCPPFLPLTRYRRHHRIIRYLSWENLRPPRRPVSTRFWRQIHSTENPAGLASKHVVYTPEKRIYRNKRRPRNTATVPIAYCSILYENDGLSRVPKKISHVVMVTIKYLTLRWRAFAFLCYIHATRRTCKVETLYYTTWPFWYRCGGGTKAFV